MSRNVVIPIETVIDRIGHIDTLPPAGWMLSDEVKIFTAIDDIIWRRMLGDGSVSPDQVLYCTPLKQIIVKFPEGVKSVINGFRKLETVDRAKERLLRFGYEWPTLSKPSSMDCQYRINPKSKATLFDIRSAFKADPEIDPEQLVVRGIFNRVESFYSSDVLPPVAGVKMLPLGTTGKIPKKDRPIPTATTTPTTQKGTKPMNFLPMTPPPVTQAKTFDTPAEEMQAAKIRVEDLKAQKLELEIAQKSNSMISLEAVQGALGAVGTSIRSTISQSVPKTSSDIFASILTDVSRENPTLGRELQKIVKQDSIENLVRKAFDRGLSELSRAVEMFSSGVGTQESTENDEEYGKVVSNYT